MMCHGDQLDLQVFKNEKHSMVQGGEVKGVIRC